MSEIQKADPKVLRISLAIVVGGAIVGVALIRIAGSMRPAFEAWIREDVHARLRMVFVLLTLATTGPALAVAGYFWRHGQRVVSAEGEAAGRRGHRVQVLAAVIGLAGVLLAFFLWRFVFLLERAAA